MKLRYVLFAAVALVLLQIGAAQWIWNDGYQAGIASVDKANDEASKDNEETKKQDGEAEKAAVIEYVEVEKIIYRDGKTIIEKVPVYVTPKADSACTVPLGFVSLHDAAIRAAEMGEKAATGRADAASATADAALPVPEWVNLPAGLPLSKVEEVSAKNATAYGALKARYGALVNWSQTQCYGPP